MIKPIQIQDQDQAEMINEEAAKVTAVLLAVAISAECQQCFLQC